MFAFGLGFDRLPGGVAPGQEQGVHDGVAMMFSVSAVCQPYQTTGAIAATVTSWISTMPTRCAAAGRRSNRIETAIWSPERWITAAPQKAVHTSSSRPSSSVQGKSNSPPT